MFLGECKQKIPTGGYADPLATVASYFKDARAKTLVKSVSSDLLEISDIEIAVG